MAAAVPVSRVITELQAEGPCQTGDTRSAVSDDAVQQVPVWEPVQFCELNVHVLLLKK
jgi:hypothetical protein